ncbi:MAG: hypothetical protein VB142_11650 [Burkholderia sp.]
MTTIAHVQIGQCNIHSKFNRGKMENATADAAVTSFCVILNRIDAQRRLSMTYD